MVTRHPSLTDRPDCLLETMPYNPSQFPITDPGRSAPCTLESYAKSLAQHGTAVASGTQGTFWGAYEAYSMMRVPIFALHPPSSDEVRKLFRNSGVAVVTYLLEPGPERPANAWWYVCTDTTYTLEKLSPPVRRNVRRGLKELTIGPLTPDQVLSGGLQAFCDTRRRVGLSDGPEEFHRRFTMRAKSPGHVFLGAWRGEVLAAFLSITEIDDWAEIEGAFSRDDLLSLRPNEALMYSALSQYLVQGARRLVSYGLSSIQRAGDSVGLHAFKTKVGFQARGVRRVFVLHPLLRPFATRFTLRGVSAIRDWFPRNRLLSKACGVLNLLTDGAALIWPAEKPSL